MPVVCSWVSDHWRKCFYSFNVVCKIGFFAKLSPLFRSNGVNHRLAWISVVSSTKNLIRPVKRKVKASHFTRNHVNSRQALIYWIQTSVLPSETYPVILLINAHCLELNREFSGSWEAMSKRIELIKKFVFSNNAVSAQPIGVGYPSNLDQWGVELRMMSHEDCYTFVMHHLYCTDACTATSSIRLKLDLEKL